MAGSAAPQSTIHSLGADPKGDVHLSDRAHALDLEVMLCLRRSRHIIPAHTSGSCRWEGTDW